jgi:hypothetical protein
MLPWQTAGDVESAVLNVPAGHGEQTVFVVLVHWDEAYNVAAHVVHGVHTVCEVDVHGVDAYFPVGHVMQAVHSTCEVEVHGLDV